MQTKGYAAKSAKTALEPFSFDRREVGDYDVGIEIQYCGVCHSDIHQARNEWQNSVYPMVPGHEIVGRVTQVGSQVTKFKVGDLAGVGCFVDSCRTCENCKQGEEQYCDGHLSVTYNGYEKDKKTLTQGGYSKYIVVDQTYTLKLPSGVDLAKAAPLLCAGITTYSPLKYCGVGKNSKVAILGLGGLGHMGLKLAASFGADVSVFSRGTAKEADAKKLGASDYISSSDSSAMAKHAGRYDFVLNTISAPHDINAYLNLLKRDGTLCVVGVPEKPMDVHAFSLIARRRKLMGSLIGGIRQTQEMLDYCTAKGVLSEIELIPMQSINTAYERMIKGDVRYRFVIDTATI